LARLLASLHGYLATTDASGVQLHLYTTGTIRTSTAMLDVETSYPWDGRIEVGVESHSADPWTLALRIPAWCSQARASIDGEPVDIEGEYLRLHRTWVYGARIVLELDMPPRLVVAHPRVDAVRGCVAMARGPLLYCVEQADLDPGVALDDVRLDPREMPRAVAGGDVLDVPITISAHGVVADGDAPIYADWPVPQRQATPIEITAIPYYRWANREPGAMRVWLPVLTG
jgi:hypothetical protein